MKIVPPVVISALIIVALPVLAFGAEPKGGQPKKTADPKGQTNATTPTKACAEYGEGFRRVEGTSTCVKIGGYVRFQTGRSR